MYIYIYVYITLSKAEKREKKQQAQPEPPTQKPLSRDEMGLQADCAGQAAYDAHLRQNSLDVVLVVQAGGHALAPCVWCLRAWECSMC